MSEKEIRLFTVFLQKIDEKIGTDRIYTLLGWISITIILIYFVYFTIENIGGGR